MRQFQPEESVADSYNSAQSVAVDPPANGVTGLYAGRSRAALLELLTPPAREQTYGGKPFDATTFAFQFTGRVNGHLQRTPELGPQTLSLGADIVRCNGHDPTERPIVVCHNLIAGMSGRGTIPIHFDPMPAYNMTTGLLALPCLGPNENCLCIPPQPGLVAYYQDIGLLGRSNKVHILWPEADGQLKTGYPYLDPVSLAKQQDAAFNGEFFVSAFTSPHIRAQAGALGLEPVQSSDSFWSNNKAAFKEAAERFGFTVLPGMQLNTFDDARAAVERFGREPGWIKFSNSWGGDLVIFRAAPLTEESLMSARNRIRTQIARSMELNDYAGLTMEELWPEHEFGPRYGSIILEQDAGVAGSVALNGSNVMTIARDGEIKTHSYFKQLTVDGIFLGSMSFDPEEQFGPEVRAQLDEECRRVGRYCAEELGLFGMVGVDFMLLRGQNGRAHVLKPVVIELNGRPPISSCSYITASKLGARAWSSQDVEAPAALTTIDDFERAFTLGGCNLARGSAESGMVVPLMMESLYGRTASGEIQLLHADPKVKILVLGPTQERCEEILKGLADRNGIDLRPYARDGV